MSADALQTMHSDPIVGGEIFKGAGVTHGGQVVNDCVRAMLEPAPA